MPIGLSNTGSLSYPKVNLNNLDAGKSFNNTSLGASKVPANASKTLSVLEGYLSIILPTDPSYKPLQDRINKGLVNFS